MVICKVKFWITDRMELGELWGVAGDLNLHDIFELLRTKAFISLGEHVKTILLFYGLPKLVKWLGEQNLKICTYV